MSHGRVTIRMFAVAIALVCAMSSRVACQPLGAQTTRGVVERFGLGSRPQAVMVLPAWLREVSGLAVTPRGRVLAHGDERGVVAEIDLGRTRVTKAFSLGSPAARGDFEGVAVAGERLFFSTSDGMLLETSVASRGAARVTRHVTPFGRRCELEGLAFEPVGAVLLLGCKVPREPELRGAVTLFRWSVANDAPASPDRIPVPLAAILARTGSRSFQPSAVEVDPCSGHVVILAGPERAVVEITTRGEVVGGARLASHHRQPEGLTFVGDSLLLVADEGGKHHATLSVYQRVRSNAHGAHTCPALESAAAGAH